MFTEDVAMATLEPEVPPTAGAGAAGEWQHPRTQYVPIGGAKGEVKPYTPVNPGVGAAPGVSLPRTHVAAISFRLHCDLLVRCIFAAYFSLSSPFLNSARP